MKEVLEEKDYFKTSDICLAAALCCCDYQIETVDRSDLSKAIFYIRRNKFQMRYSNFTSPIS